MRSDVQWSHLHPCSSPLPAGPENNLLLSNMRTILKSSAEQLARADGQMATRLKTCVSWYSRHCKSDSPISPIRASPLQISTVCLIFSFPSQPHWLRHAAESGVFALGDLDQFNDNGTLYNCFLSAGYYSYTVDLPHLRGGLRLLTLVASHKQDQWMRAWRLPSSKKVELAGFSGILPLA